MPDVAMDFEAVEATAYAYDTAAEDLDDMITQCSNIASSLRDGAMQGNAGEELAHAFDSRLAAALRRLQEKFNEMEDDLMAAVEAAREGIETSSSRYAQ